MTFGKLGFPARRAASASVIVTDGCCKQRPVIGVISTFRGRTVNGSFQKENTVKSQPSREFRVRFVGGVFRGPRPLNVTHMHIWLWQRFSGLLVATVISFLNLFWTFAFSRDGQKLFLISLTPFHVMIAWTSSLSYSTSLHIVQGLFQLCYGLYVSRVSWPLLNHQLIDLHTDSSLSSVFFLSFTGKCMCLSDSTYYRTQWMA